MEKPTDLETAIEAPYHLIVSPSARAAFRQVSTPKDVPDRSQLWRTYLSVRTPDGFDDDDAEQRIVRALWTPDKELPPPDFDQPLTPSDREAIRNQTHGSDPANADTPLLVRALQLSSLGAWFDWRQSWEFGTSVVDYRHQAFMGRDGYVRVAYPGFLFPFGHRCVLVKVTQREVKHRDSPRRVLWQRWFIILREPTREYSTTDRDNPFGSVTVSPLVTPDIEEPPAVGGRSCPRGMASRSRSPSPPSTAAARPGAGRRRWCSSRRRKRSARYSSCTRMPCRRHMPRCGRSWAAGSRWPWRSPSKRETPPSRSRT